MMRTTVKLDDGTTVVEDRMGQVDVDGTVLVEDAPREWRVIAEFPWVEVTIRQVDLHDDAPTVDTFAKVIDALTAYVDDPTLPAEKMDEALDRLIADASAVRAIIH